MVFFLEQLCVTLSEVFRHTVPAWTWMRVFRMTHPGEGTEL